MKSFEQILRETFDEDELDVGPLPTLADAMALTPELAAAAQKVYDDWDEDNIDEYAGGGICHFIAEEMVSIFDNHDIEAASVSSSHEQHVYAVIKVEEGVYTVDISYGLYERGAGFSWTKIPNVVFAPDFVDFYRVSVDPNDFEEYTEMY